LIATCEEKLGNIKGALTNLLAAAVMDAKPYAPGTTGLYHAQCHVTIVVKGDHDTN
jgi:hypothetical protein